MPHLPGSLSENRALEVLIPSLQRHHAAAICDAWMSYALSAHQPLEVWCTLRARILAGDDRLTRWVLDTRLQEIALFPPDDTTPT